MEDEYLGKPGVSCCNQLVDKRRNNTMHGWQMDIIRFKNSTSGSNSTLTECNGEIILSCNMIAKNGRMKKEVKGKR